MSRTEVVAKDHQDCEGRRLPPPMKRYLCWLRRVARRVVARRAPVWRPTEQVRVGREAGGRVHDGFEEAGVES